MEDQLYCYRVNKVLSVYDGDTCTLDVNLGFGISFVIKVRLANINTPELRGGTDETKAAGYRARNRLRDILIDTSDPIFIKTTRDKTGKYGRYIGEIFVGNSDVSVNQMLVNEGLAENKSY